MTELELAQRLLGAEAQLTINRCSRCDGVWIYSSSRPSVVMGPDHYICHD